MRRTSLLYKLYQLSAKVILQKSFARVVKRKQSHFCPGNISRVSTNYFFKENRTAAGRGEMGFDHSGAPWGSDGPFRWWKNVVASGVGYRCCRRPPASRAHNSGGALNYGLWSRCLEAWSFHRILIHVKGEKSWIYYAFQQNLWPSQLYQPWYQHIQIYSGRSESQIPGF